MVPWLYYCNHQFQTSLGTLHSTVSTIGYTFPLLFYVMFFFFSRKTLMNVHQTHVKMVRHALMESMDTHALVLGQAIQVLLRCRVYLSLTSRNLYRSKRKLCSHFVCFCLFSGACRVLRRHQPVDYLFVAVE